MKKRYSTFLALLFLGVFTSIASGQVAVNTALYRSLLSVQNTGVATTGEIVGHEFSGYTLVDQNFLDSDTLNSVIVDNIDTAVPGMPSSTRIAMEAAKQDDGGVFTDYTTEANNATINDVVFLPATPVVNDAFYYGLWSPGRILTVNIGTEGEYDQTIVYEYWDGSTWSALDNVLDNTDGFQRVGVNVVTYDMPLDWAETTIDSVLSYWVRARVSAFTSVTTSALGTQIWWESGMWFSHIDSIAENVQLNHTLYMGGSTDLVANHQIFPGAAGIVTPDDSSIELGQAYNLSIEGYFNTEGTSTGDSLVSKGTAFRIYNPASGTIRLDIDSSAVQLDVTGVTSGYYTITAAGTATSTSLTVSTVGSTSGSNYTVPDNATSWTFIQGSLVSYVEELLITFPVTADWPSAGALGDGATLTETAQYIDYSGFTVQGTPSTVSGDPRGGVIAASSFWVVDTGNNLVELDETDVTLPAVSSCAIPGVSAANGLAYDSSGTEFWYADMGLNDDLVALTSACTENHRISIAAYASNTARVNFDGTNVVVFGETSGPNFTIFSTVPAFVSSNQISAMTTDGYTQVTASTYVSPFHYVLAAKTGVVSLWRMTDHTDAVKLWETTDAQYGRGGVSTSASSTVEIQPADNPFDATTMAQDSGTWYFFTPNPWNQSTFKDSVFTTTTAQLNDSHIRILNDWGSNTKGWGDILFAFSSNSGGLGNTTTPPDGVMYLSSNRATSGTNTFTQTSATGIITPGLAYSFGGQVTCGGEQERIELDWLDSSLVQVGSTLTAFPTCSGAFSDAFLDNQIAPALSSAFRLRFETQCSGSCGGSDLYRLDAVQLVQNTAHEAFPTSSTNFVTNPSFELIYDSADTFTWESQSVNLTTITDVGSTAMTWSETTPSDSSLLIETSIDGGSIWSTATNGGSIPGISMGDDLTGVSLLVRGTFTPSTAETDTPELASMLITLSSATGDGLRYQLNDIPSLNITDRRGSNDGALSFPLPTNALLLSSSGPLTSTGVADTISSDATTPELVDVINPGDITSQTILGNNIPLSDLWIALSGISDNDVPPIMFWIIIAGLVILVSGSYTFLYTNSVAWTGAVMGMFTLGFVNFGGGVLPFWVFFFFAVMAMASGTFAKVRAM